MPKVLSKRAIKLPKPLLKNESVVVLKLEEYERFKEDLEMLSSPTFAKEMLEAQEDIKKGRVYSLQKAKQVLGL